MEAGKDVKSVSARQTGKETSDETSTYLTLRPDQSQLPVHESEPQLWVKNGGERPGQPEDESDRRLSANEDEDAVRTGRRQPEPSIRPRQCFQRRRRSVRFPQRKGACQLERARWKRGEGETHVLDRDSVGGLSSGSTVQVVL